MNREEAIRLGMARLAERCVRLHLLRAYVAICDDLPGLPSIIDDLLFAIIEAEEAR